MRLKSIKSGQSTQAKPTRKDYLLKSDFQWLQPFLRCASGTASMALVLSGAPVCAEEQLPILRTSPNTILEFNTRLDLEPFSENQTTTNITANTKVDFGVIVLNELDQVLPESLLVELDEPVLALAPNQASSLSAEPPIEATESSFSLNRIAQANTSAPQPSEPFSSPETPESQSPESSSKPEADTTTPPSSEPSSSPEASDTPDSQPSESSSNPVSNNGWQFSVEPYFFVPLAVQGDVTVAGRSASIDLGLDDVLNLDRAFDAGLRLEARNNRLGFILDAFYISAAQSGGVGVTLPDGSLQRFGINTAVRVDADANISIREFTVDAAVFYRVVDTVLGSSSKPSNLYPRLVVAPILGLRTKFLWEELEVDNVRIGDISLPIEREFDSSRTTVEPLIGTQIGLDLSERWAINMRGDVSGFNINADQDFTWNFLIGAQYRISPNISLQLAYRFNGFDFEDGEGLRRTRLNLYQNGLWLSSIFQF